MAKKKRTKLYITKRANVLLFVAIVAVIGAVLLIASYAAPNRPEPYLVTPSEQNITVSGSAVTLDAGVRNYVDSTSVEFNLNGQKICTAALTEDGFICHWDSTTMPNGTYELSVQAYDTNHHPFVSSSVALIVQN